MARIIIAPNKYVQGPGVLGDIAEYAVKFGKKPFIQRFSPDDQEKAQKKEEPKGCKHQQPFFAQAEEECVLSVGWDPQQPESAEKGLCCDKDQGQDKCSLI